MTKSARKRSLGPQLIDNPVENIDMALNELHQIRVGLLHPYAANRVSKAVMGLGQAAEFLRAEEEREWERELSLDDD